MPLDDDSIKCLEQVKKGKPARFVMVNKGMKVLSIVAYRTGPIESRKTEAKEAGHGEVSWGVVDGSGANIVFKLAREDFEAPPMKTVAPLREFLNDKKSGFSFKPTFEIVEKLPDVAMDDAKPPMVPPRNTRASAPPSYRSGDDWRNVFASINGERDATKKGALLRQSVGELKAETQRAASDAQLAANQQAAQEQTALHNKVRTALETILSPPQRPVPQVPQTAPPLDVPPQMPPLPQTPPPRQGPPPPQGPPPQLPTQDQLDRQAMKQDATRRVAAINDVAPPYSRDQLKQILAICETDSSSDFGKICNNMAMRISLDGPADSYAVVIEKLATARKLATSYIKDHQDPLVGKLPQRVQNRRDYCKHFLQDLDKLQNQVHEKDAAAAVLADNYLALAKGFKPVPFAAAEEMAKLERNSMLSPKTQANIKAAREAIQSASQLQGYQALAELQQPTQQQRAETMLSFGCFKRAGGGSSDVRLLQEQDGRIAFAYKSVAGESSGGLNVLGLKVGASTMREDVCSTVSQEILRATGLDLGFPKSEVFRHDGQAGALVEGLRGETADPDELGNFQMPDVIGKIGQAKADELCDQTRQRLQTLPDKITADSMQDVVLTSMLTVQWDAKWGNMIVDDQGRARPIDGGTAFPTKAAVERFEGHGGLGISNLLVYPEKHPQAGQPTPQSQQPMSPQKVQAVLQLDADALVRAAKTRRDELLRTNPEFAADMMEDSTVDIMKASIQGAQAILQQKPNLTLAEFVQEYEQWFLQWAPTMQ